MGREIYDIINDMAEVLNASQMQKLQEVLVKRLSENTVFDYLQTTNMDFLDLFLTAKHLEGCSDKTIRYYRCNIEKMLDTINIPVIKITTEMLRKYLVEYQTINNCGKVTIDNIRRSLSTFFSWLEEEDYIIKSPMKRIHKVKTAVIVKDTIPDEKIEILRDNCNNLRDRAMIDFLFSTGIRVGELVRLNIDDIDFSERECVVYGKGDKERKAKELLYELIDSKTVLPCYNSTNPRVSLTDTKDFDSYKLYLSDTGLFVTLMFIDRPVTENDIYAKLLSDKLPANLGYLYENLVAQMITVSGRELYYHTWEKKGSTHYYEVDFLISEGSKINAFEVKSSGSGKHESIREFCRKFSQNINKAYLISQKDAGKEENLLLERGTEQH